MCLNPLEATGFIKTYFKPRLIQFCVYSYLSEWGGGEEGTKIVSPLKGQSYPIT